MKRYKQTLLKSKSAQWKPSSFFVVFIKMAPWLQRGLTLIAIGATLYYNYLLTQYQPDTHGEIPGMGSLTSKLNATKSTRVVTRIDQGNRQNAGGKPFERANNRTADKPKGRPPAKSLLKSKPPFEDKDMITLYPADSKNQPLIKSPNTVVTGYFRIRSKHGFEKYDGWMRNMLSLQDAMVIFTEPDLVDQIKTFRNHAANRTIIIPISLEDLPIGRLFSENFWQDQLYRDPEKKIHRSYQVFWIWLSKTWFVTQAIRMNIYDSDIFVWSDIGCFRQRTYNSKTMVVHRENVPSHEILQMAHHKPNPPPEVLFNDKYKHKAQFYHSGSQFVGYKDTLLTFHEYFLETVDRFLDKDMIIVEDQAILQSVCLSYPEICAYVPFDQVQDNSYFGLRKVLHSGGEYSYWRYRPNKNK